MARDLLENAELIDPIIRRGMKYSIHIEAITDNYQLTVNHPTLLFLDPNGGAKDVLLPAEASSAGLTFLIVNDADASENLVVKEDSDTTTILTIGQGAAGILWCDGTDWHGFGLNTEVSASLSALTLTGTFLEDEATATATADGLTTGLITAGTQHVTITSADANNIVTLPTAVAPMQIRGYVGANGCEIRTPASSNETINNVDADGTQEMALPASSGFIATCYVDGAWIVEVYAAAGTRTIPTPD